jgi:hypothetical protein
VCIGVSSISPIKANTRCGQAKEKKRKGENGKMHRKMSTIIIMALSAALVCTIVLAQWYMNRPVSFTGTIELRNNLQVYSDAECTQIMTSFNYNTLHRADVINTPFWIKNIGEGPITIRWNITGLPSGFTVAMAEYASGGSVWPADNNGLFTQPVNNGTVIPANMTITIGQSAALGGFGFTLNIYGTT